MSIKLGNNNVGSVYLGNTKMGTAYLGANQVMSGSTYPGLSSYTIAQLSTISSDLTAKGTESEYYEEFNSYIGKMYNFGSIQSNSLMYEAYTNGFQYNLSQDDFNIKARLIGILHDDLSVADGEPMKKAGLTFWSSSALPYRFPMNRPEDPMNTWDSAGINGGWDGSDFRTVYLDLTTGSIGSALPTALKSALLPVLKNSAGVIGSLVGANAVTSQDYLFLLSITEICGDSIGYSSSSFSHTYLETEGSQYAYFSKIGARVGMQIEELVNTHDATNDHNSPQSASAADQYIYSGSGSLVVTPDEMPSGGGDYYYDMGGTSYSWLRTLSFQYSSFLTIYQGQIMDSWDNPKSNNEYAINLAFCI